MIPRFTAAELAAMPTLASAQAANLKYEDYDTTPPVRVWLARTGVSDGEPYDNRVSIEHLTSEGWRVVEDYPGGEIPTEDESDDGDA